MYIAHCIDTPLSTKYFKFSSLGSLLELTDMKNMCTQQTELECLDFFS